VICLSVCMSATLVSPAKTAEPIEMPSDLRTWLGPRDHVLDGGSDPPMGRGNVPVLVVNCMFYDVVFEGHLPAR